MVFCDNEMLLESGFDLKEFKGFLLAPSSCPN